MCVGLTTVCHPCFLPYFQFLSFGVAIWGSGGAGLVREGGSGYSNPDRTTKETDNNKRQFFVK